MTYSEVDSRTISGTGVLLLPGNSSNIRVLKLEVDVLRDKEETFESFKYFPSRSRKATCVLMQDDYVVEEITIDYARRCFYFYADITGQNLIALKCAYKGVLESFANLGTALGLNVISVVNKIEDYKSLEFNFNRFVFVCEGSTAIKATLYSLEYEDDCESLDTQPPPEPPSEPPEIVPPGTPLEVSEPYPDDTITNPDPLDDFPEPPTFPAGEPCQAVDIVLTLTFRRPDNSLTTTVFNLQRWGTIQRVVFSSPLPITGSYGVSLEDRGNRNTQSCQPTNIFPIIGGLTGADTLISVDANISFP